MPLWVVRRLFRFNREIFKNNRKHISQKATAKIDRDGIKFERLILSYRSTIRTQKFQAFGF